jgi:formate-dependent nitrite reductase membrane component NrfD
VHTILAAAKAGETFNGDYYIAIVTILPILMVAVEVLTNFNRSIPIQIVKKWPLPFQIALTFFYLFSPIIAAVGVIIGVLALMHKDTSAIYRWITFACLVSVLGFLALSSTVYLLIFDTAQTAREREEAKTKNRSNSGGAS